MVRSFATVRKFKTIFSKFIIITEISFYLKQATINIFDMLYFLQHYLLCCIC